MKIFSTLILFISLNSFGVEYSKEEINRDIKKLKKMKSAHRKKITNLIHKASVKYQINPKIMLAIIKVESNFEQSGMNKYKCKKNDSHCGDFSIAQINYKTWKNKLSLDIHKLKSNNAYAIDKMGELLSKIKKNRPNDKLWFLRYHSGSYLFKIRYLKLVERYLKRINFKLDFLAKEELLRKAVYKYGWKRVLALYTHIPSVDPLIKYE